MVAVARKLAVLCWHLLARQEDYAFKRPSLYRQKIRRLELMTGAERMNRPGSVPTFVTQEQHRMEREIAAQAELAYKLMVKDLEAGSKKKSAGAINGRAFFKSAEATTARQASASAWLVKMPSALSSYHPL